MSADKRKNIKAKVVKKRSAASKIKAAALPLTVKGLTKDGKPRLRAPGGGRKPKHDNIADRGPIRIPLSPEAWEYVEQQKQEFGIDFAVTINNLVKKEVALRRIYDGKTELQLFGEFAADVPGYSGFAKVVNEFIKEINRRKIAVLNED